MAHAHTFCRLSRRRFLAAGALALGAGLPTGPRPLEAADPPENPARSGELLQNVWWVRDARNPVLPPVKGSAFDAGCCMNPFVLRRGDEWHLYYAGADDQGRRRVCLATAPVTDPAAWKRHGPLLENGPPGSFDHRWCVLPHVVQIAPDRWHLYYTGNSGKGSGLSAFPGIGLAVSRDGKTWEKHADNPVLERTGKDGDPDAVGVAGGSVLRVRLPGGGTEWRFYYTGCPTLGKDLFLHQQKRVCLAVSADGVRWEKKGAIMLRDPERDYENVAAAGPVVHQNEDGTFRMWYSAIGTRWGYYSICCAESDDGLAWRRGQRVGDNLQLGPAGSGWEKQMVEYPSVVRDGHRLRLFYCGNGYGTTGIGTAVASALRATVGKQGRLRIVAAELRAGLDLALPLWLSCDEGILRTQTLPALDWQGPDSQGALTHAWQSDAKELAALKARAPAELARNLRAGLRCRVVVRHVEDGLELTLEAANTGDQPLHNLAACAGLTGLPASLRDGDLGRTFLAGERGPVGLRDLAREGRARLGVGKHPPLRHPPAGWGAPLAAAAARPVLLRSTPDRAWTLVLAWDDGCELGVQGEDAGGLVAAARLGDLEPGQSRQVRGRLLLLPSGPEEALKRLP